MSIQYDPAKKHCGYMNENIGIPEKPEFLKI